MLAVRNFMNKIYLFIFMLLLIGCATTQTNNHGAKEPSITEDNTQMKMDDQITSLRKFARNQIKVIADNMEMDLDYSIDSIKKIEQILALHHDDYMRTKDDEGINGLCMIFGMYIIDVIEKNFEEGTLKVDHPEFGEATFPYYWRNNTIFPIEWCRKRMFNGPADNIEFKFKSLIELKSKDS